MPYRNPTERNAYARKWYAENREKHKALVARNNAISRAWWPTFKATLKCMRCGEDHPACLDFHHRDPSEKDRSLSHAIGHRWSKARMLREIEKCDVLCANCHRKLHAAVKVAETAI
jgi:L-lactate utilization protein LutB